MRNGSVEPYSLSDASAWTDTVGDNQDYGQTRRGSYSMNVAGHHLGFLRELTWSDVLLVLIILVGSSVLVLAVRRIVRRAAESAPSHRRLLILRTAPLAHPKRQLPSPAIIIPVLVEP